MIVSSAAFSHRRERGGPDGGMREGPAHHAI